MSRGFWAEEEENTDSENSETEEENGSVIDEENSPSSNLKDIDYDAIRIDQWVKVVYEEEIFVGIVREKQIAEVKVQYLSHPFGIKLPQLLESENTVVFYEQVYETDVKPILNIGLDEVGNMFMNKHWCRKP